jgi:cell wall-associated NlpC family hydrolase
MGGFGLIFGWMGATAQRPVSRSGAIVVAGGLAGVVSAGLGLVLVALLVTTSVPSSGCTTSSPTGPAASIALGAPGTGVQVGATEYGGPGDPSSGTVGASGANLVAHPDSYAELGGYTFQTATAMGGLPYMTPLRVTWADHSAIAYKRDFGLGGGPVAGRPRVIDLWWQFAGALGIPYQDGLWSGPVRIERPPQAGAGNLLGQPPAQASAQSAAPSGASADGADCGAPIGVGGGVPIAAGPRAQLLGDGRAAAPADAPAAVQAIIAAGNQIVGKPYLYGGGHGLPMDQVAPAYDCSSSVEHLLYGARLLSVTYDAASGTLESFGLPGPGRWITIYASADHVFMYVAGLRWDTHNAAGPQDGSAGIGWHPLVRGSDGFVARHPVGL